MHRNTAITISFLAIIATLLIGLNLGRKLSGENLSASPQIALNPSPVLASPYISNASPATNVAGTTSKTYLHHGCGISFEHPADFTIVEATNAARLTAPNNENKIDLVCDTSLAAPPVTPEKTEIASIAGQMVTIYHDQQVADTTPVDVVILTNTRMNLDIAIMGFGEVFNNLLKTVKIL